VCVCVALSDVELLVLSYYGLLFSKDRDLQIRRLERETHVRNTCLYCILVIYIIPNKFTVLKLFLPGFRFNNVRNILSETETMNILRRSCDTNH
jgi:hypothetical protein